MLAKTQGCISEEVSLKIGVLAGESPSDSDRERYNETSLKLKVDRLVDIKDNPSEISNTPPPDS